jgi:amino acid transporter
MGLKVHIFGAGVAMSASLTGMALIVQSAGAEEPLAYPITGIFFLVVALTLLIGLAGLLWDTLGDDARALHLLWFATGGSFSCGLLTFYSVGLFFLLAALNWGVVALLASRRRERPLRQGLLFSLAVACLFTVLLIVMRNVQSS